MQRPLQITVHNLSLSDAAEARIQGRADKLEHFSERIIGCRVTVDAPHHHKQKGESYEVRILITLPGEELMIKHEPNEDIYVAIRDAFDAAERRLKEHSERRSGEARLHGGS
ncbi:ribosomal subunit interface protein [Mariprofundus ferrinatatus]|uniref:Ribosomal subunit interface protein n=1 Tax=Mariprofundus ferrinatatus TaxID=1921087 RepID=A0A2K8L1T2_9PROT|nr:HPF/RaiA family ribosome-associated protein [Mariprofundus ferrinatatus]ATX81042.1 ribosomal subunit interface protein [Mariprofundus ferrinatatus]